MKYDIHNLPNVFEMALNDEALHKLANEIAYHLVHESKFDVDQAIEYGDTRFDQPEEGRMVLIANWNDVPQVWQDILEADGYLLDWQDEVLVCDYGKVWHTHPQNHGDMPKVKICDGYVLTADNDPSEWIEECEMTDYNQPIGALPNWMESEHLVAAGFTKQNVEEYENGFHKGQDDVPSEIAKTLFENGADSVVFHATRIGQFDARFNVWSK